MLNRSQKWGSKSAIFVRQRYTPVMGPPLFEMIAQLVFSLFKPKVSNFYRSVINSLGIQVLPVKVS